MNRRGFLKIIGTGAAAFALTPLNRKIINTLAPAQTTSPTVNQAPSTETPMPPGMVAAPARGLGSNSNYYLYSDCMPVTDLSVTIEITKDIVSDIGFGIQLNAYSPQDANVVWQQYFLSFETADNSPLKIYMWVDNWPSDSFRTSQNLPTGSDLINYSKLLDTLPDATMPAGYKITISLKYDPAGNVNGATYSIVDTAGKVTSADILLESLKSDNPVKSEVKPVTVDYLAPINSFELNVVGPINGKHSYLSTGAGTITYTASSPMTVSSKDPQCTTAPKTFTAETANSMYGALPPGPSQTITQSFEIEVPSPYAPGIPFAVSQRFGVANETDVFAVDSVGQLGMFYVRGQGHWRSSKPKGPAGMGHPGAAVAVSEQFGAANQTDVFLFDQNGQLNVFSVVGSGDWNGPKTIGSTHVAPSGAALAASLHFGVDGRTDVFVVDKNGQLNVFWVVGAGSSWQGPKTIGAKGFARGGAQIAVSQHFGTSDQTDVFVVDLNGQLNVFSAVGAGDWSAPKTIGASGLAGSGVALAASQRFGVSNQTDVYLVDLKGQLNVFSAVGSGDWSAAQTIGSTGLTKSGASVAVSQHFGVSGQTDVFVVDKSGQLTVFSVQAGGQWSDATEIGPQNEAPSGAYVVASQQFGNANRTDIFYINQTDTPGQGSPTVSWADGSGSWTQPKALVNDV